MEFLYVGDLTKYTYFNTNLSVTDSLAKRSDVHLHLFDLNAYFNASFLSKIEMHFVLPLLYIARLNRRLVAEVKQINPDVVYIARGVYILPATIKKIKQISKAIVVSYNNDDPFSPQYEKGNWHQRRLWTYFKKSLPLYDINIVFRPHNVADYQRAGAQRVHFVPHYYVPGDTRPDEQTENKTDDVVFIGHYEADGRAEYLKYLLQNGIKVKLYGTGWPVGVFGELYTQPIQPVYGNAYITALKSARIALVFLSQLNRDVYTYRSYEIPGTGTFMLAPRNDFILTQFEEGKEAAYFANKEEMLKQVQYYLANDAKRREVAAAGLARSIKSGYDVDSRVNEIIELIKQYL